MIHHVVVVVRIISFLARLKGVGTPVLVTGHIRRANMEEPFSLGQTQLVLGKTAVVDGSADGYLDAE